MQRSANQIYKLSEKQQKWQERWWGL